MELRALFFGKCCEIKIEEQIEEGTRRGDVRGLHGLT